MARTPTDDDFRLARRAYEKQQAGRAATVREAAALRRVKAHREREQREAVLRSVGHLEYCALAGRTSKTVKDHAIRYGIPCGGASIDLYQVLRAFHDLLKQHGRRILTPTAEESAQNKIRNEQLRLLELERKERERQLLPRDEVHAVLAQSAAIFRHAVQTVRSISAECATIIEEAIDDAERMRGIALARNDQT